MAENNGPPRYEWSDQERKEFRRKRRVKNFVMLGLLATFVVVVYFVALIRMGGG